MADADHAPAPPPILNYGQPHADRLVAVARFPSAFEANLAAGKLESEGVPVHHERAMVTGIDAYTGAQGARLYVHPDDAARAAEILRTTPARNNLLANPEPLPPDPPSAAQVIAIREVDPKWPAEGAWMVLAVSAIAHVDPTEFLQLSAPLGPTDAPILVARRGWLRRRYRYLTSRHGMTFTTESVTPLTFPEGVRVVPAKRIFLP